MALPRPRRGGPRPRPCAARGGAAAERPVHALYLCNVAAPDETVYEKSVATLLSTMDTACAIGADGVVIHVGSHRGAGFEAGLARAVPALERVLERCSGRTWLLLENSAGAGDTSAAPSPSSRRSSTRSAATRGSASASTPVTCTSRASTSASQTVAAVVDEVDERLGLDRLRALHVNDAADALGSNRDHHANVLEGELGERMGAFLAHPALQELPAVMETPGPDGHGPDAAEIDKLRALHARWTAAG